MKITELNEDDRPREKLILHGPEALSTAELLAILVGSGAPGITAVELMQMVLMKFDDKLRNLAQSTVEELSGYDEVIDTDTGEVARLKRFVGIGKAKAVTLLAACELGRRRQMESLPERMRMTCSKDIYEYFRPLVEDQPVEHFYVLCLNSSQQVIRHERLSTGGLDKTLFDVRTMMRTCLLAEATAIAVCHNHPSGSAKPSKHDNAITSQLSGACRVMNIKLIDHIIVSARGYYSFADEGKL